MNLLKYCIIIVFLLSNYIQNADAQTVKTENKTLKINGKERPAISVVSEAEAKPLRKAWKKFLKKKHKVKTDDSKNTVTGTTIKLDAVSPKQFDLYTVFNVTPEGSEMLISAAPGYDIYFSPQEYAEDYQKLRVLAEGFVKNYMKEEYASLIKEKRKAVAQSEKTERQLQKETKKLEKQVEKDRKELREIQKEIDKKTATIDNNKKLLPELKKILEEKRQILKALEEKQKDVSK